MHGWLDLMPAEICCQEVFIWPDFCLAVDCFLLSFLRVRQLLSAEVFLSVALIVTGLVFFW